MLLRMQFVRGLKDNDVRGRLSKKTTSITFKGTVQTAISLESSKLESNILSQQVNLVIPTSSKKGISKDNSTSLKDLIKK
jgi:hypothetical protein